MDAWYWSSLKMKTVSRLSIHAEQTYFTFLKSISLKAERLACTYIFTDIYPRFFAHKVTKNFFARGIREHKEITSQNKQHFTWLRLWAFRKPLSVKVWTFYFEGNAELPSETIVRLPGRKLSLKFLAKIMNEGRNTNDILIKEKILHCLYRKILGKGITSAPRKNQRKNFFSSKLQSKH